MAILKSGGTEKEGRDYFRIPKIQKHSQGKTTPRYGGKKIQEEGGAQVTAEANKKSPEKRQKNSAQSAIDAHKGGSSKKILWLNCCRLHAEGGKEKTMRDGKDQERNHLHVGRRKHQKKPTGSGRVSPSSQNELLA